MTAARMPEIGAVFGRLTVVAAAPPKNGKSRVAVQCACKAERVVRSNSLLTGNTTSCGCTLRDPRSHGMTGTRTYSIWTNMRARCAGQISPEYYADLGVSVCTRWLSFENFLEDMGEAPEGKSLDRFPDPAGNYEPSNCRWATPKEQRANQRISTQQLKESK